MVFLKLANDSFLQYLKVVFGREFLQINVAECLFKNNSISGATSLKALRKESLVRFLEMYRGDYRIHNFESMHSDILRTIKDMCIFPLFVGIRC